MPYGLDGPIGESSSIALSCGAVHHGGPDDEHAAGEARPSGAVEQVVSAQDVDAQRAGWIVERLADVRAAGAVIDGRRLERADRVGDGLAIEQVDRRPSHARIRPPGASARGVAPGGDRGRIGEQVVDEMAAGESGRAGDQGQASHA